MVLFIFFLSRQLKCQLVQKNWISTMEVCRDCPRVYLHFRPSKKFYWIKIVWQILTIILPYYKSKKKKKNYFIVTKQKTKKNKNFHCCINICFLLRNRFSRLKVIHLERNELKTIPSELLAIQGLTSLNLSDNKIDQVPTEIYRLAK